MAVLNIPITSANVTTMGAAKDTVKIRYNGMNYLKFRCKDFINELNSSEGKKLNVVGRTNLNYWNGTTSPQMFIDDYEIVSSNIEF